MSCKDKEIGRKRKHVLKGYFTQDELTILKYKALEWNVTRIEFVRMMIILGGAKQCRIQLKQNALKMKIDLFLNRLQKECVDLQEISYYASDLDFEKELTAWNPIMDVLRDFLYDIVRYYKNNDKYEAAISDENVA